jgi:hypothetical protein
VRTKYFFTDAVARGTEPNSPQWTIAHNQIQPQSGMTLKVEKLDEFKSILVTALDHALGDQLGTFGKITVDKKSHVTVPLCSAQRA